MGTNDWILLTLSALLLIPPTFYGKAYRQTLQRRNRLRIPLSDIAEPSEIDGESSIRRTFSLPCNWFAAVRAALGAYLLIQQWPQILGEEAAKEFPYQWIALAVITVGLVVQTILYVGRRSGGHA